MKWNANLVGIIQELLDFILQDKVK